MAISIVCNLSAMNAGRMLGINQKDKVKSTNRLSSGYKINRAADDAAGLAISEKMRKMIRGLAQGTENAQDGISWVQIGDGAHWEPDDLHVIADGKNELTFTYSTLPGEALQTMTITVPPGKYSTLELLDEIDTSITDSMGGYETWLNMEYCEDGHINATLEGGALLDSVSGSLSYLLFDMYKGGSTGALLGTTIFTTDTDKLNIVSGRNDHMEFVIEDLKGNQTTKSLTIPEGGYTRDELIDKLNDLLTGTSVTATAYGRSIKMGSNKEFVTSFKGNMFSIDGPDYTSVFYDNVKDGIVTLQPAVFKGGCVLISDSASTDEEHTYMTFDNSNNTLTLQPDGQDHPVTVTIPEGRYNLTQIRQKLQSLFDAEGLGLTVGTWSQNVATGAPYSDSSANTTFSGLTITTASKGPDSAVNIDKTSSAYHTLFTDRQYIYYGTKATTSKDIKEDYDAYFRGSKSLDGISAANPFTLTSSNNSFNISLSGMDHTATQTRTITLQPGDYNSVSALINEINTKLGAAGLGEYVKATQNTSNHALQLVEVAGGDDVNGYITVEAAPGSGTESVDNGYLMLFIGPSYTERSASSNGVLTFDTPGYATGNTLNISVKGKTYTVDLSGTDKNDPDAIAAKINDTLQGETITYDNGCSVYSYNRVSGTTSDKNFTSSETIGDTWVTSWSDTSTGHSSATEGATGGGNSTAASLKLGPKLKADADGGMDLDSSNNKITLTVNNTTLELSLTAGHYTQESLRQELQDQIDARFGIGNSTGATVTLSGDQLVITSKLPGNDSKISCGTDNSSFLSWLNTNKRAASCTSNVSGNAHALKASGIKITDGVNDHFKFSYKLPGTSLSYTEVDLDLAGDTYDRAGLISQINTQIQNQGLGDKIEASADDSGYLVLKTKDAGAGAGIRFSTAGSSASDAMFGALVTKTPGSISTSSAIQNEITIEAGKQEFSLYIDNVPDSSAPVLTDANKVTVELEAKTYHSRAEFLAELNDKLNPKGVTASLNASGYLTFTTNNAGKGTGVNFKYVPLTENPSSAMQAIYGTHDTVYPAVEASFDAANKLTLRAKKADGTTDTGTTITVRSRSSAGLLADNESYTDSNFTRSKGYHSRTRSSINGVSFTDYRLDGVDTVADKIVIDQYNNSLSFKVYTRTGSSDGEGRYNSGTGYNISLAEGTYTYDKLRQALQDELDGCSAISGKTTVTVDDNGVRIEANSTGNSFYFDNLRGGFYLKVLSAGEEKTIRQTATDKPGYQDVDGAYTIGRKDVSHGAEIIEGVCDQLSFDLMIQDHTETLSMTLDPGKYDSKGLLNELQKKIDEQLVAKGYRAGIVKAGIGGITSGIAGSNDQRALNFRIADEVQAPGNGTYRIDGVSGNAAFEIFYQTEGRILPAYIMGAKDVAANGVDIQPDKTDLSFLVDNDTFTINLDPGHYTKDAIVQALNDAFTADNIPLMAGISSEGGKVKISYDELGYHDFHYITGNAKNAVFFDEDGGEDNTVTNIQVSGETPDNITISRSECNASLLRVNSLNLLDTRYIHKAIDRISDALDRVSALRTNFGVTQNRLEHTINNNRNKEENLQASESIIRDTDMSREMVKFSSLNILEQAGISMLAQSNQKREAILTLLG